MLPEAHKGNSKAFMRILDTITCNLAPGQVLSEEDINGLTNLIQVFFDQSNGGNSAVIDFFINNFSVKKHEV